MTTAGEDQEMKKVSILLSIYRPDRVTLKEQLDSLDSQTYQNKELLVWNDCPDETIDRKLFEESITRFPVFFYDEKKNLGYIRAFEKLTALAEGDLVSYCDQDDIWEPEKIEKCVEAMRGSGAIAAVCDKSLMTAMTVVPTCPILSPALRSFWVTVPEIGALI